MRYEKIHYYITNSNLEPILETNYFRAYYLFMNKISLTFDKYLKFKNLTHITNNNNYFKDTLSVMEIKFNSNDILYAKKLINSCILNNTRFSKYLRDLALTGMAQYL